MSKRICALGNETLIQIEDDVAATAITPGHLVTNDGSGNIIVHGTAGGNTQRWFALERDELGKGIDDAYAIGDTVKVGCFHPGQRVNAFIASGQNLAKNAKVESAGDGTFRVLASGTALGRVVAAVNNAVGPTAARCTIEIM